MSAVNKKNAIAAKLDKKPKKYNPLPDVFWINDFLGNYQLLEKEGLEYYYWEHGYESEGLDYVKEILFFTDEYIIRLECHDFGITEADIDIPEVTIDLLLDLLSGKTIEHVVLLKSDIRTNSK